jgi:hypothetical protein
MLNAFSMPMRVFALMLAAMLVTGCGGGGDPDSGGGSASRDSGSGNPDADKALMAKIGEHWLKTKDGWTTEYTVQLPLNPPRRVLRQYREFNYTLEPEQISESDRLNGIEWKAWADFGTTPMRWWHEEGDGEHPTGWSLWDQKAPSYRPLVYKRSGQWKVEENSLDSMFEGFKPTKDIPAG